MALLLKRSDLGLKLDHQPNANQTTFGCLLFKEKKIYSELKQLQERTLQSFIYSKKNILRRSRRKNTGPT